MPGQTLQSSLHSTTETLLSKPFLDSGACTGTNPVLGEWAKHSWKFSLGAFYTQFRQNFADKNKIKIKKKQLESAGECALIPASGTLAPGNWCE